jgi:hypothetical protein
VKLATIRPGGAPGKVNLLGADSDNGLVIVPSIDEMRL